MVKIQSMLPSLSNGIVTFGKNNFMQEDLSVQEVLLFQAVDHLSMIFFYGLFLLSWVFFTLSFAYGK